MGVAGLRATYVHDNLDSTHGALHHGCYLCVWEGVKAYSSRHMTDSRNMPPAARTIAAWRTHDREVRMETVNVAVRMERQTRDGAAKLLPELGISTTQAINMLLKQAVREQRMPFEVTARPTIKTATRDLGKEIQCTFSQLSENAHSEISSTVCDAFPPITYDPNAPSSSSTPIACSAHLLSTR